MLARFWEPVLGGGRFRLEALLSVRTGSVLVFARPRCERGFKKPPCDSLFLCSVRGEGSEIGNSSSRRCFVAVYLLQSLLETKIAVERPIRRTVSPSRAPLLVLLWRGCMGQGRVGLVCETVLHATYFHTVSNSIKSINKCPVQHIVWCFVT